jgi:hypothetical protein
MVLILFRKRGCCKQPLFFVKMSRPEITIHKKEKAAAKKQEEIKNERDLKSKMNNP